MDDILEFVNEVFPHNIVFFNFCFGYYNPI